MQQALLSHQSEFERSQQSILKAINDFTEFANRAGLAEDNLPLSVVRYVLESAFASPEQTGSQFMTGQITVCSMVPMRSIPFRIVAVLGLNDGEFPRNRPPLGFDLMANDKPRLGDRSRRGDDRYLFLEAILSARDSLYLSYQGLDIRKNEARPPSLVLEELLDYLHQGYGFDKATDVRTMPLQPFSEKNYLGDFPSFEDRWGNLREPASTNFEQPLSLPDDFATDWQLKQWLTFFSHPVKYFAQHRLGLTLEQSLGDDLIDDEPFALNALDRYSFQQKTISARLAGLPEPDMYTQSLAASAIPLSEIARAETEQWQLQAAEFSDLLTEQGATQLSANNIEFQGNGFTLSGAVYLTHENKALSWRLANLKGRDIVQTWLHHLLANTKSQVTSIGFYRGKDDAIDVLQLEPIESAAEQLNRLYNVFKQGYCEPLYLHSDLLTLLINEKTEDKDFARAWADPFNERGLSYDPYIAQFWQEQPDNAETLARLNAIFSPLLDCLSVTEWEADDANA
jgi:exodeoxyribonuclease V gamma subunit